MIYIFSIIWSLDRNIIDKKVVLVIILFDDLSNNFNFTDKVSFIKMLYFNVNTVSNEAVCGFRVYKGMQS